MSMMRLPFTTIGQFVSGTAMVAIFAAGCGGVGSPSGDLVGTIVNSNKSTDLIGGVRLKSGEAVYNFGTWLPDGSVGEITSIVYHDASGKDSTLYLESGRPSKLIGADGSRLDISYTEVSSQRLAGEVAFTPADGQTQTYPFDIDLLKTAQQVSDLVQQLADIQIPSSSPPDVNTTTSKPAETSLSQKSTGKADLAIAIPIIFVVTGFTLHLILGQLLNAILITADALVKAVTVSILTPFIFMGNLMRLALGQPLITLSYNTDYIGDGPVVITVPRPQPY